MRKQRLREMGNLLKVTPLMKNRPSTDLTFHWSVDPALCVWTLFGPWYEFRGASVPGVLWFRAGCKNVSPISFLALAGDATFSSGCFPKSTAQAPKGHIPNTLWASQEMTHLSHSTSGLTPETFSRSCFVKFKTQFPSACFVAMRLFSLNVEWWEGCTWKLNSRCLRALVQIGSS